MMLPLLMSRWTMPCWWAAWSPFADLHREVQGVFQLLGPDADSGPSGWGPSTNFHCEEAALLVDLEDRADVGVVERGRRLGLVQEAVPCTPRPPRHESGMNFSATVRLSLVSSAFYTTPIPPSPSFSRIP